MPLRFRFPREGSPVVRGLLSDVREITGESEARLLVIREVRELLELLVAGLSVTVAAVMRDLFDFLGAAAAVSVCPKAERNQTHFDGYFSLSRT